jgi:hypothetical protein
VVGAAKPAVVSPSNSKELLSGTIAEEASAFIRWMAPRCMILYRIESLVYTVQNTPSLLHYHMLST